MLKGRNQILSKIAPRAALTAAAAVLFSAITACEDEPYYFRPDRWGWVAGFPENVEGVKAVAEGPGGDVYVIASDVTIPDYPRALVYRYDGSSLEEVFRGPYDNAYFEDLAFGGGALWVCGKKYVGYGYEPYLVKFEARTWSEIEVPPTVDADELTSVFPASRDFCWLETARAVYVYDGGRWAERFRTVSGPYNLKLAVAETGRAFVCVTRLQPAERTVYVSDDAGATWAAEPMDLGTGLFDFCGYPYAVEAAGAGLFISTLLYSETLEQKKSPVYMAVIGRDGANPGQGSYDISYLVPSSGGYGYYVRDMAFRDGDNGYVVGYGMSIAREGGAWYPEEVWHTGYIYFIALAAGRSTYWAALVQRRYYRGDGNYYLYRVE